MDLRAWFLVQQRWNCHEEEEEQKLFLYETRTVGVEQRRNRKTQRAFDQQRAVNVLCSSSHCGKHTQADSLCSTHTFFCMSSNVSDFYKTLGSDSYRAVN